MTITIIGTGNMAKGIASRALDGGHSVVFHAREQEKAEALVKELQSLVKAEASVSKADVGSAIDTDMVVLAVPYSEAANAVKEYGEKFANKILVDITNPLDWNTMEPVTPPGSSAAEEIAKLVPTTTNVVKAFNTTFAATLVTGMVGETPLDVYIAGDDEAARKNVAELVRDGHMRPIDVGALKRARMLEGMTALFIIAQSQTDAPMKTALKIVSA